MVYIVIDIGTRGRVSRGTFTLLTRPYAYSFISFWNKSIHFCITFDLEKRALEI
ncbi:hypothetical protein IMSAGC004_01445 [Bacteroidaceae bacterium]|nr:hypothetical protein IMSAGC004_01445 [Bacteroidaceae bacterium]